MNAIGVFAKLKLFIEINVEAHISQVGFFLAFTNIRTLVSSIWNKYV